MTRALATTSSWLLLCSLSFGQEDGYRDLSFPNTTGQGSTTLSARVYYPATSSGANTPMVTPPAGGYPVVVFCISEYLPQLLKPGGAHQSLLRAFKHHADVPLGRWDRLIRPGTHRAPDLQHVPVPNHLVTTKARTCEPRDRIVRGCVVQSG